MKFVFMPLCFRWRANLELCRTSLHTAEQSLKFKITQKRTVQGMERLPHLIWSRLLHVDISEGLPAFCALSRPRRQKGRHNNLETKNKGV